MKAIVTEIGAQALAGSEPMLILFGTSATSVLKEHSIIQEFEEQPNLTMTKGAQIKIDDQTYEVTYVGQVVNQNLNSIAHVTLVFDEVPTEDPIGNGLYLTPAIMPTIKTGTVIEYLA